MLTEYQHTQDVLAFLQTNFPRRTWELTRPPSGRGHETYIAQSRGKCYFIKLNAQLANYQVMASCDLTPSVIITGFLDNGTSILVQSYIEGRNPSWQDFQHHLESFATIVNRTHHNLALKTTLPTQPSEQYKTVGLLALARIQQKWKLYRPLVPTVANFVDESLAQLKKEISQFTGAGLAASHNDICNRNWLITPDGEIYLVDLDAMSQNDPAHDMGSLLWWYYPPELRQRFLYIAGYSYDTAFKNRMQIRMGLHCLDILLPRANSFDSFNPASFAQQLTDFRAVLTGQQNPHGYHD